MNTISLHIPGDKSISHRAVIFGSLANGGTCEFRNFLMSEDCLNTINCFRQMGVEIEVKKDSVMIKGVGLYGLEKPDGPLYVGNSGTTIRLLAGLLAGQSFDSVISGDESIQKRPMKRIIDPLRQIGVMIKGDDKNDNIYPPLVITGGQQLHGIQYKMPVASAQVDGCLRLASLYADPKVEIDKQGMTYRDHTERMLNGIMDFVVDQEIRDWEESFFIPSDISSAAFFMVAGLLVKDQRVRLLNINTNPTRAGILNVLSRMIGKDFLFEPSEDAPSYLEEVQDIIVESSSLKATVISGSEIPTLIDEIPIIALAASLAEGTTVIKDAAELRVKESDRVHTIATELNRIGAKVTEQPDGLIIEGVKTLRGPQGELCKTYGDHRIAMMLKIANLVTESEIILDDEDCIKTSFPGFEGLLEQLR